MIQPLYVICSVQDDIFVKRKEMFLCELAISRLPRFLILSVYICGFSAFVTTILWTSINAQSTSSVAVIFQNIHESTCITNSSYGMIWNDNDRYIIDTAEESTYSLSYYNHPDCPLGFYDSCTPKWLPYDWRVSNSIEDDLSEAILDRRWEELVIEKTYPGDFRDVLDLSTKSSFSIPISIRKKSNAHIILCESETEESTPCYWFVLENLQNVTGIRKCRYQDIPRDGGTVRGKCRLFQIKKENVHLLSEKHWRHLVIEKKNNTLKLFKLFHDGKRIKRELVLSFEDKDSSNRSIKISRVILHAKTSPALWKIHKYDYVKPGSMLGMQRIGHEIYSNGNLCLSFFLYMCQKCSMLVLIEREYSLFMEDVVMWNATYTAPLRWEEVRITIPNLNGSLRVYVHPQSIDIDSMNNLWYLDDFRMCRMDGYRFLSTHFSDASCQILNLNQPISPTKGASRYSIGSQCDAHTFSSHCIPCSILSYSQRNQDYCVAAKVWELRAHQRTEFSCTAGYSGKDCMSECPTGYYGSDCKYLCGQCSEGCDGKNGKCTQEDCSKAYSSHLCYSRHIYDYKVCPPGYFGYDCSQPCICDTDSCDMLSGGCIPENCLNNFRGERCDIPPVGWVSAPQVSNTRFNSCTLQISPSISSETVEGPYSYFYQIKSNEPSSRWMNVSEILNFHNITPVEVNNLEPSTSYSSRVVVLNRARRVTLKNMEAQTVQFRTSCKEIEPDDLRIVVTNTTAEIKPLSLNSHGSCPLHDYKFRLGWEGSKRKLSAQHKFTNLNPNTVYTLYYLKKNGEEMEKTFKTSDKAPMVRNIHPEVSEVGLTSCVLQIPSHTDHRNGAEEPDSYFFQIRTNASSSSWFNVSTIYNFDGIPTPVEVKRLRPSTTYFARVIVFKQGTQVNIESIQVKAVGFETSCEEIEPEDIRIDVTNSTAEVKMRDYRSMRICPLREYTFGLKGATSQTRQTSQYKFAGLESHTVYTLYYLNRNGEIIEKTFKTSDGVPDKVRITTMSSTDTTMTISWSEPKAKNGNIKYYIVRYQLQMRKACDKLIHSSEEETKTEHLSITLPYLMPYSVYQIQISAFTSYEGDSVTEVFETKPSDTFDHEIEPIKGATEIYSNSFKIHFLLNCNLIHGPVFIVGKALCLEKWCEDIAFSFKLKTTTNRSSIVIHSLEPYSHYKIESRACRRNDWDMCHSPKEEWIRTKPSVPHQVQDVMVYSRNATSISLRWKPPSPPTGKLFEYRLNHYLDTYYYYGDYNYSTVYNVNKTQCAIWPDFHCVTVSHEILERREYILQISSRNMVPADFSYFSTPITVIAQSDVPEPPYNISVTWLDNDMKLSWNHPNVSNGDLTAFLINVYRNGSRITQARFVLDHNMYQSTYTYLVNYDIPSTTYNVEIVSENEKGPSRVIHRQYTSPPPKPVFDRPPFVDNITSTSINIVVPKLNQSMIGYPFRNYICILINDTAGFDMKYETPLQRHIESRIIEYRDQYRVIHCGENNSTDSDWQFEIGKNQDQHNPSLKAGTYYTIVIYTENEFEERSSFEVFKILSNTTGNPDAELSQKWNYCIYGSVMLLVILLGIFVLYRRLRYKSVCNIMLRPKQSVEDADYYSYPLYIPSCNNPQTVDPGQQRPTKSKTQR